VKAHRFKFQVHGAALAGKFVFNLEEGAELYLDITFQPFTKDSDEVCFFLKIEGGRTLLDFVRAGSQWNGRTAPRETVALRVGDCIVRNSVTIEILDCPKSLAPMQEMPSVSGALQITESTRDIDVSAFSLVEPVAPVEIERPQAHFSLTYIFVFALGLACGFGIHFFQAPRLSSAPVMAEAPLPAPTPIPASTRAIASVSEPQALSAPNAKEVSALLLAIERNKLEEVQGILEQNKWDQEKIFDEKGRSPFIRTAAYGHVKMLQYFIAKGANVNSLDSEGNTALMWALLGSREKTVSLLLSAGADPTIKRKDGTNAIMLARAAKNARLEKMISERGAY
jgi:hypothetical protein